MPAYNISSPPQLFSDEIKEKAIQLIHTDNVDDILNLYFKNFFPGIIEENLLHVVKQFKRLVAIVDKFDKSLPIIDDFLSSYNEGDDLPINLAFVKELTSLYSMYSFFSLMVKIIHDIADVQTVHYQSAPYFMEDLKHHIHIRFFHPTDVHRLIIIVIPEYKEDESSVNTEIVTMSKLEIRYFLELKEVLQVLKKNVNIETTTAIDMYFLKLKNILQALNF